MNDIERREHQRHYFNCQSREGWTDEEGHPNWPSDDAGRAKMGRGLFALQLIELLDGAYIDWWERITNPEKRRSDLGLTPGSVGDCAENEWQRGFASMTDEQRQFVLRVIEDLLQRATYSFGMALDRFDYGDLSIQMAAKNDVDKTLFNTNIHPLGSFELFQDLLAWREAFSRVKVIDSDNRNAGNA